MCSSVEIATDRSTFSFDIVNNGDCQIEKMKRRLLTNVFKLIIVCGIRVNSDNYYNNYYNNYDRRCSHMT